MQRPIERPLGVTLIAILLAINGIVGILGGLALFASGSLAGGIIGIAFGLVLLYVAYGMWTLQRWAWLTTLVIEGLNGLFALITIITSRGATGAWISLILAGVIIAYLVQPHVRDDFARWRGAL